MDAQAAALQRFFRSAVQNLSAASEAVVKSRAEALKRVTQAELKSNFKRRVGGVKVYPLPPRGDLGPAAYVSVKPQFLRLFEDGGTVQSKGKLLVILLPEGARLKFKRPGKGGWGRIWAANQHRFRLVPANGGYLVLCRVSKRREVPVYFLGRQATVRKRLNFGANAAKLGAGMDVEIQRLLEGKL